MHYAYIQLTVLEIAGQSESPCSRRRQGRVCRAWSAWWAGEGVYVKILQVILYR